MTALPATLLITSPLGYSWQTIGPATILTEAHQWCTKDPVTGSRGGIVDLVSWRRRTVVTDDLPGSDRAA